MELNEKNLLDHGFKFNWQKSNVYWKFYELEVNGGNIQVKLTSYDKNSGSHLWITFPEYYYQKFWFIKNTSKIIKDVRDRLQYYEDIYFLTGDNKTSKRLEFAKKTLELLIKLDEQI